MDNAPVIDKTAGESGIRSVAMSSLGELVRASRGTAPALRRMARAFQIAQRRLDKAIRNARIDRWREQVRRGELP